MNESRVQLPFRVKILHITLEYIIAYFYSLGHAVSLRNFLRDFHADDYAKRWGNEQV